MHPLYSEWDRFASLLACLWLVKGLVVSQVSPDDIDNAYSRGSRPLVLWERACVAKTLGNLELLWIVLQEPFKVRLVLGFVTD